MEYNSKFFALVITYSSVIFRAIMQIRMDEFLDYKVLAASPRKR